MSCLHDICLFFPSFFVFVFCVRFFDQQRWPLTVCAPHNHYTHFGALAFGIWYLTPPPSQQASRHSGSVQQKYNSLVSFISSFPISKRERDLLSRPATTWLVSDLYILSRTLGFDMYYVFYLQFSWGNFGVDCG